jgi:hypothetical protein
VKKKKIGYIIFLSIIILAYVYLTLNSPLVSNGTMGNQNDKSIKLIELENFGFADIVIKDVLVNETEPPKTVELGISRSNHMVTIANDPEITFHSINKYKIKPRLSGEEMQRLDDENDNETIRHYGLKISLDKPIESVTVKYTYLLIPFTLHKDVRMD